MKKILNLSKILSAITITLLLSSNNISLAMFNYLNVDRDLKPVPSAQVRPDGTVDPYGIVNRGDGNLYYVDASGAEQSLPFYEQLTPSGRPQLTAAGRAFFNKQPIPVEAPVASVPEIIADSVPEADVVAPTISDVADTAPEVVTFPYCF